VEAVPMTITRTARKPTETKKMAKTVDDIQCPRLQIKWSHDYDIIAVHGKICAYLKESVERKSIITSAINALRSCYNPSMSMDEICQIKVKLELLENDLQDLEKLSMLSYVNRVSSLLNEYKQLSKAVPKVFGEKDKVNAANLSRKTEVVEAYLAVAVEYYPLDIQREIKSTGLCCNCNGVIISTGDQYQCTDCSSIHHKAELYSEKLDGDDGGFRKSDNENSLNFKDILAQFQGTYPIVIPEKILTMIKDSLNEYQGFEIQRLTRMDLIRKMKELGLGGWYKHLNKIFFLLTGKKSMDISKVAANIARRGELVSEIYDDIKDEDRSNIIHGLYMIWLFLMNEGVKPCQDEFSLLKSRSVEVSNIGMLTRGFEILRKTHPEFKWEIFQIP
jgi:hypothetical protein